MRLIAALLWLNSATGSAVASKNRSQLSVSRFTWVERTSTERIVSGIAATNGTTR